MLYDVVLKITYDYEYPATGGHHLLRLMPAHIEGRQHLISGYLDVIPQSNERNDRLDFFGNSVTEAVYHSSLEAIEFNIKGRVECFGLNHWPNSSPNLLGLKQEIAVVKNLYSGSPHHFLGSSSRVRINPEMTDFANRIVSPEKNIIELVNDLGMSIYHMMTFDADATTVDTPVEEAFERRHGVCQDYTHIMIACLRSIGIPAGYVSGFLRTIPPEGQNERLEGADAMHAWVRAWCGHDTGWIEFDPTNAMFVNTDHIVIAYGRDYDDIAPVKGILKTYGKQKTEQGVDVIPV